MLESASADDCPQPLTDLAAFGAAGALGQRPIHHHKPQGLLAPVIGRLNLPMGNKLEIALAMPRKTFDHGLDQPGHSVWPIGLGMPLGG